MTSWTALPSHGRWLENECLRLLAFGQGVALEGVGAASLDEVGRPAHDEGIRTWITSRMVHVYSLGTLMGIPGSAAVADRALTGLTGRLRDTVHGGWFHGIDPAGSPLRDAGKRCYDHAFVMLAASSAVLAGRPRAKGLLADATAVFLDRFWDDDAGLPRDAWDDGFAECDPYRGLNSTMHSIEAMLAVADAVEAGPDGDAHAALEWRQRAGRIAEFVVTLAKDFDGRLPEHFTADWEPDLELNQDQPDDPFKPFGATPGHGLEWARLLLHLEAATAPGEELMGTARLLFDRAVADAWAVDGADGFVYTTDWEGKPVVAQRMHWVLAEAIAAAATLHQRTGQRRYADLYAVWWDYAEAHLLDHEGGSWWHELDPLNRPDRSVWPGKPDLYHAVQCTLIPRLPLAPTIALALREGRLG